MYELHTYWAYTSPSDWGLAPTLYSCSITLSTMATRAQADTVLRSTLCFLLGRVSAHPVLSIQVAR